MTKSQLGRGQIQRPAGRNKLGTFKEEKQKPGGLRTLNEKGVSGRRWGLGANLRGQHENSQERTGIEVRKARKGNQGRLPRGSCLKNCLN